MAATTLTIKIDHANFDPFTIKVCKASETKFQFKSSCDGGKEFEIPVKGSQQKLMEEVTPYYTEGIRSMTFSTNSGSKSKDKVVQSWDQKSKLHQSHLEKAIKEAVISLKAGPVMSQKSKSKHAMLPLVNPKRRKVTDEDGVNDAMENTDDGEENTEEIIKKSAKKAHKKAKTGNVNGTDGAVGANKVVKQRKHKKSIVTPSIVPEEGLGAGNVNQVVAQPMTNGSAAAPATPGNILS